MIFNAPMIQILNDDDHQTIVLVSAYYNEALNANAVVVQANTCYGGNTSLPCIMGVNCIEYSTSIANGWVTLEWVSSTNQNTTIMTFGRNSSGTLDRYIKNLANTPTGDLNINVVNMEANDAFTLIVSLLKEYQGQTLISNGGSNTAVNNVNYTYAGTTANVSNYGAGAWANAQAHYLNAGAY